MASFKIHLDTRVKKRDGKYNLTIRIGHCDTSMYLNLKNPDTNQAVRMTEKQFESVFVKKSTDESSIHFRETCNGYLTKCERIFSELRHFEPKRFREIFYQEERKIPQTLLLQDLFEYFISQNKEFLKVRSIEHIHKTQNILNTLDPNLTIGDIDIPFLKRFEKQRLALGNTLGTINSYLRDLRRIINYFTNEEKLIPKTYQYPFGRGGYSIKSYFPKKRVLSNAEIKSIVEVTDFDTPAQKYSRDIWLFLYRCNGINFVDLLRMRWDNIQGNYFIFFRKKTETTRKNNIKEIVAPIDDRLLAILEKIGDKSSPFILGKVKEGYSEKTFLNITHKNRKKINTQLGILGKKLNLSLPLKMGSARYCYATTLRRAGKSIDDIGEMMGHSTTQMTTHYLAALDIEKTDEINSVLF